MLSGFGNITRVLVNPNYRWYLGGNFCTSTGNWVQRVGMGWLTWELTHSGAWLGVIAFADLAPTILFGLLAGAIIDRVDSLTVLRVTQVLSVLQGIGLAVMTLAGHITIEWLVFFATLHGCISAFNRPARMTVVYNLAGREMLSSAIALNSMIFNTSRFTGPGIGGAVIAYGGVGWAFALNALTYLFFFIALMAIKLASDKPETPARKSLLSSTAEGLRYVRGHQGVMLMMLIMMISGMLARPFTELLPGLVDAVFHRGVNAYSTMLILHGSGAMVGAYWLAQRGAITGLTRVTIAFLCVTSLSLIAFSLAHSFWLALPVMFITGAGFAIMGTGIQTLIQTAIDTEMRGRVMALYGIVARAIPAFGALIMGISSEFFGLMTPILVGATLSLGLWVWARGCRNTIAAQVEREQVSGR